jgi:predicted nucleic acid-binding protein
MRFVLDASVTVAWCFQDEQDARADAAFAALQSGASAVVPSLWWFEIRNAALLGVRRNRITDGEMTAFLKRLAKMFIELAQLPEELAVLVLASRHRLTFYDAAYLELAQRENIALATLDGALARAATAEGVALIGAA